MFLKKSNYMENLQLHFRAIFLIILLPSIILESGFNMKKSSFFRHLGTVLMYAFFGTFIAMISLGLMIKLLTLTGWTPEFTWRESFAFSALISATDPVTVLAIFKEINTDMNLYTLVFGESIFNDAI
jgi:NhaP-type Na+/H+ or K+/H+ antiporter